MKYYESKTYGKVCETAFGADLKQLGMMTKAELDILMEKSIFDKAQSVLEIGCGSGQIAAYINNKTSARFMCIDVDAEAVAWATNTCKSNENMRFRVLDARKTSDIKEKFSKILAIDSLYFVSDMQIDTFMESLKTTLESLYALLEVGGEIAVFWSELPFFKPERKSPECTQLGICLKELGYEYTSCDLTDFEIAFWKKFRDALVLYEEYFIKEGSKDIFDSNINEAEFFIGQTEKGCLYRNLYLIKKLC